ncbi:phage tail family protein [Streptomyces carpaticus]|uniref:phage distal tail protein n=1 Tax=Streptomyces carpaticus TaxID=285558 RepID=UPI0021FAE281|nr:phage tail family protein [Streptomyces carpaticus]
MAVGDRVTLPGHVQVGELLLGPGTPYGWTSLTGWEDEPPLDNGSVPRAGAHGSIPGPLLAQSRIITLEGLSVHTEPGRAGAAVRPLAAALAPAETEQPLVIQIDRAPPLMVWARCLRRMLPVAVRGYALGRPRDGAVQWECSDPRRYELAERRATAGLPMAEPGLDWRVEQHDQDDGDQDDGPPPAVVELGLGWPLDWGTPGSTGALTASNDGDAEAHPVIVFRGPVTRPSLTCLESGDAIEYDITLAAGDELVIDTAEGTVTLNGTASRLYTVTARSIPEQTFTVPPGVTSYAFRAAPGSSDPAAAVEMRWRSAYW